MNKVLRKLLNGQQAINLQLASKWMTNDIEENENPPPSSIQGVMIVPVFGPLAQNCSNDEKMAGMTAYTYIMQQTRLAMADSSIHTVVYYINSPGGCVTGNFECANVIAQLSKIKRTIAWSDDMVCSAAFALANECREIYTIPSARVGNIGTILTHYNLLQQYKSLGIDVSVYYSGADKGIASSNFVNPTEEQNKKLQEDVELTAEEFRQRVIANRPSVDKSMLTGWDFDGSITAVNGLIDGTFNDTTEFVSYLFSA